jgi:hypothetical protein
MTTSPDTTTPATDHSTDKTTPATKLAASTHANPDAIDSLKQAVQISRDSGQTHAGTLTSPDTASLFQPTQPADKTITSEGATPSYLDISSIFDNKGQAGDHKTKVPGASGQTSELTAEIDFSKVQATDHSSGSLVSGNGIATDKQLQGGPWDTLLLNANRDSGPMHFDNASVSAPIGGGELLTKFQQEQTSGHLTGDSFWQKYVQTRAQATGADLQPLIAAYEKEHGKTDMTKMLETAAKGTLDEKQTEKLHQLQADPSWKQFVEKYEGQRLQAGGDAQALQKYVDSNPDVKEDLKKSDAAEQPDVAKERQHLSDWAEKNLKEPELSKFKKDMTDFEERAKRDGLSQDEILKTYQQIDRINGATGDKPLSPLERQHIAQEVMHQAADPTDISQGYHNTCNVTAVETRTYTRDPAAAAKLVADVALTGEYHAADGTVVKVDPTAHDQSKNWPPIDGQRTHASEIFEVTAVNIHYAQENKKNGTDIRYEQKDPAKGDNADTGERLMDYSKHPPQPVTKDGWTYFNFWGKDIRDPNLVDKAITDISNSITGKNEKDVLLQAWGKSEGGVTAVHSEDELKAKLKDLKDQHKLPAIIFVDTNNEPFYTDSGRGAAGGSGGYHVVTVTDYDEKTGAVCVDNQWDKGADHGKNNPINVHDLYTSMQFKEDAEKTLKKDVEFNRAHGIYDPQKESDLIRHQLAANEITAAQAEEQTKKIMAEMSKHWGDTNAPQAERESEWKEVDAVIHQLPPDAQIRLAHEAHKDNLITDNYFKEELRWASWQMVHNHDHAGRVFGYNPWADGEYAREQDELKKAMADLPENLQKELLEQVGNYIQQNV